MSYKKVIRDDGTVVMEPTEPSPIICTDLTFEEVQELTFQLFLRYLKATNRKTSEFRCLGSSDGFHEEYLFEKWARETNPPELPTILAFDTIEEMRNPDEWMPSFSGAVMDFVNSL